MEALFTYLISLGRISPALLIHASNFPARTPDFDLSALVYAFVRGTESDTALWSTWRHFTRPVGAPVWVAGLDARADLNGSCGSIESFHADRARLRVRLPSSEVVLIPGRNLLWNAPGDGDGPGGTGISSVFAVLARALNAEIAWRICGMLPCTRCGDACAVDGRCFVPHTEKASQLLLSRTQPPRLLFAWCWACGKMLGRSYGNAFLPDEGGKCWDGRHVSVVMEPSDLRRRNDLVTIAGNS